LTLLQTAGSWFVSGESFPGYFFDGFINQLLQRGPLGHIEVILDSAMAEHPVLLDFQGGQVHWRQGWHEINVGQDLGISGRPA